MTIDRERLKNAIKNNPEGHEKLTGRYYLTERGIEFFNGSQPRPIGAVRIPSFGDDHPFRAKKLGSDDLAELLVEGFLGSLLE